MHMSSWEYLIINWPFCKDILTLLEGVVGWTAWPIGVTGTDTGKGERWSFSSKDAGKRPGRSCGRGWSGNCGSGPTTWGVEAAWLPGVESPRNLRSSSSAVMTWSKTRNPFQIYTPTVSLQNCNFFLSHCPSKLLPTTAACQVTRFKGKVSFKWKAAVITENYWGTYSAVNILLYLGFLSSGKHQPFNLFQSVSLRKCCWWLWWQWMRKNGNRWLTSLKFGIKRKKG